MVREKPNELELLGTNQGRPGRFLVGKTATVVPHPSVPLLLLLTPLQIMQVSFLGCLTFCGGLANTQDS
jgi:hypothetical protein